MLDKHISMAMDWIVRSERVEKRRLTRTMLQAMQYLLHHCADPYITCLFLKQNIMLISSYTKLYLNICLLDNNQIIK